MDSKTTSLKAKFQIMRTTKPTQAQKDNHIELLLTEMEEHWLEQERVIKKRQDCMKREEAIQDQMFYVIRSSQIPQFGEGPQVKALSKEMEDHWEEQERLMKKRKDGIENDELIQEQIYYSIRQLRTVQRLIMAEREKYKAADAQLQFRCKRHCK